MIRTTRITRRTPPAPSAELTQAMEVIAAQPTAAANSDDDGEGSSKVDYPAVISRYMEKITNRGTAIRAFCVGCSGGQLSEVRDCQVKKCALYPYRMGTDPNNKKTRDRLAKGEEE